MTIKWWLKYIFLYFTDFINVQEYSVQLTFRQDWLDPRLSYSAHDGNKMSTIKIIFKIKILFPGQIKYLTMTDPEKVWMPDTFFQNEKTGHFHNIIVPNVYVRIYPNGKVLYSIRWDNHVKLWLISWNSMSSLWVPSSMIGLSLQL